MGILDSQLSAKISVIFQLPLIYDRSRLTFTSHLFLRFSIMSTVSLSLLGELSTVTNFYCFLYLRRLKW